MSTRQKIIILGMGFGLLCVCFADDSRGGRAEIKVREDWYTITVPDPMYEFDRGPIILFDQGHSHRLALAMHYKIFGELLKKDGCRMAAFEKKFTMEELQKGKILVIANAGNKIHSGATGALPATNEEIAIICEWVRNGGALLFIADGMAGDAQALAAAFGIRFCEGSMSNIIFTRGQATMLVDHEVTNGRNRDEKIDSVTTFGGQVFEGPKTAIPILLFGPNSRCERQMKDGSRIPVGKGFLQGAVMKWGKGRIAVFGEAMMFTVEGGGNLTGKFYGMNVRSSPQNAQFLLNVIHWLDGKI